MDHLDRRQLEMLYRACGRRVCELEKEVATLKDEGERELGAVRHELQATREEKKELVDRLGLLEEGGSQLRSVVEQLQEELVREKERVEEAESEKEELLEQLQSAQVTIGSLEGQVNDALEHLTNPLSSPSPPPPPPSPPPLPPPLLPPQVEQLSSSEALVRVRHHYDTALSSSSSLHQQEVAELRQQLASAKEYLQQQVRILLCMFVYYPVQTFDTLVHVCILPWILLCMFGYYVMCRRMSLQDFRRSYLQHQAEEEENEEEEEEKEEKHSIRCLDISLSLSLSLSLQSS